MYCHALILAFYVQIIREFWWIVGLILMERIYPIDKASFCDSVFDATTLVVTTNMMHDGFRHFYRSLSDRRATRKLKCRSIIQNCMTGWERERERERTWHSYKTGYVYLKLKGMYSQYFVFYEHFMMTKFKNDAEILSIISLILEK